MQVKLLVITGKTNQRVVQIKLPTVIGRSREADLKVPHPLVSRRHCELREAEGVVMLRDLGSLNGTAIGGRLIEDAPLPPGAEFSIGSLLFRVAYPFAGDLNNMPPTRYARPKDEVSSADQAEEVLDFDALAAIEELGSDDKLPATRPAPVPKAHTLSQQPVKQAVEQPATADDEPDFLTWLGEEEDAAEPQSPPAASPASSAPVTPAPVEPAAKETMVADDDEEEPEPDPPPMRRRSVAKSRAPAAAAPGAPTSPQTSAVEKKKPAVEKKPKPTPARIAASDDDDAGVSDSWPEIAISGASETVATDAPPSLPPLPPPAPIAKVKTPPPAPKTATPAAAVAEPAEEPAPLPIVEAEEEFVEAELVEEEQPTGPAPSAAAKPLTAPVDDDDFLGMTPVEPEQKEKEETHSFDSFLGGLQ
jgi:hypothetical protein